MPDDDRTEYDVPSYRDEYPATNSDDPVLTTLLHEHGILSQRDNNLVTATIALVGVGAVIVGALLLTVPDICMGKEALGCIPRNRQWQYLLAPLPLLALFSILTVLSVESNVTSQMLHKVERALWAKVDYRLPIEADRGETLALNLPSSATMTALLISPRHLRSTRTYRRAMLLAVIVVAAVLLAPVLALMTRVDGEWQIAATTLYVPPIGILLAAFLRVNLPHRRAIRDAAGAALEAGMSAVAPPEVPNTHASQVSPASPGPLTPGMLPVNESGMRYLLLPRRIELVLKSMATLLGLAIVQLVVNGWGSVGWSEIGVAFLVLFAFEYCLYQGRYMFNDVRDYSIDGGNPLRSERRRIPDGTSLTLVLLVAGIRILLWWLIAVIVGGHTGHVLMRFGLYILILMLVYDNFSETVRALPQWSEPRAVPQWSLWPANVRLFIVAPGYALRGLAGASIALGAVLPWAAVIAIGVCLGAAEAANVALGWVLEGSADVHKDSLLDWDNPSQGRLLYREKIARSPHVAALTRSAGLIGPDHRPGTIEDTDDCRAKCVLLDRPSICGPKVWNLWGAVSLAASAPAGIVVAAQFHTPGGRLILGSLLLGSLSGSLLLIPRLRAFVDHIALIATLIIAAGDVAIAFRAKLPSPWWGIAIPLLAGLLYWATRISTYASYHVLPAQVMACIARLVVGQALVDQLREKELVRKHR